MAWSDLVDLLVDRAFSVFKETAVYTPPSGSPIAVEGIFRQEELVTSLGDAAVSTVRNVLDVRRDDIPNGPIKRATVSVRSQSYSVSSVEGPDDAGVCRLVLERA